MIPLCAENDTFQTLVVGGGFGFIRAIDRLIAEHILRQSLPRQFATSHSARINVVSCRTIASA